MTAPTVTLSPAEQSLLNIADTGVQAAGALVAKNNPEDAGLIGLITSLVDAINGRLNPAAPAAAGAIASTAAAIVSAAPGAVAGAETVLTGGNSSPSQVAVKESAVGSLIGTIETIAGDVFSIFHSPATPTTPAAVVSPSPATITGS